MLNAGVTRFNVMVCDIQEVRLDELVIPSGLRLYETRISTADLPSTAALVQKHSGIFPD